MMTIECSSAGRGLAHLVRVGTRVQFPEDTPASQPTWGVPG